MLEKYVSLSPWALGSLSSFIRLLGLLYFWLKFHFIPQQFLLIGVQGLALQGRVRSLRVATLLILTLLVFERCATSSLSRKDDRIAKMLSPKDNKWACQLFLHTTCWTANAKERICEYRLVIYHQSIPVLCIISL